MIKEFEFYHGVVFTNIFHFSNYPTAVQKYPHSGNSAYIINDKIGIYIKYSSKRMSPWRFSFQKLHQEEISAINEKLNNVYVLLVCNDDGVVVLDYKEFKLILKNDLTDMDWISITRDPKKEYTVKGSDGSLLKKISKNEFPKKIFKN